MPSPTTRPFLLLTCEHGGHVIPPECRRYFRGAAAVVRSHRGWDPGALELARRLAQTCNAPLWGAEVSRLVVELNRSLHHPRLFSEFTRPLPAAEKQRLLDQYYHPHRQAVEHAIAQAIAAGQRVLHLGVHSFTPRLDGQTRRADIGLLYDPGRRWERTFCTAWRHGLLAADATLRVRRNYPYRGAADGLTTFLRTRFGDEQYAGIELEVNQRYPLAGGDRWRRLRDTISVSLRRAADWG